MKAVIVLLLSSVFFVSSAPSDSIDIMQREREAMMVDSANQNSNVLKHVRRKRFVLSGSIWADTNITYKIKGYSGHTDWTGTDKAIAKAFDQISAITPLTFSETTGDCPHITISWNNNTGVYAYAFYPKTAGGNMVFDDSFHYKTDCEGGACVWPVALHEIAHALGLAHAEDSSDAIVREYGAYKRTDLGADDIIALQLLYGDKQGALPGVRPLLEDVANVQIHRGEDSCDHISVIHFKYETRSFGGNALAKFCKNHGIIPEQCLLVGCENLPEDEYCKPIIGKNVQI